MSTYAYFVRGEQHKALCQVSMASIKKVDRVADFIVATNEDGLVVPGAEMLRFKSDAPMMVANLEAQIAVLDKVRFTQIMFLDTDILLLKPFPQQKSEALVVTWRDTVGGQIEDKVGGVADVMPYNYGVISVLPGMRTFEAFIWMRERVRKLAPQLQVWWGNQIALNSLCGPRPAGGEVQEQRHIQWQPHVRGPALWVRKLPGSIWNYTPRSEDEDVSERGALHFKGHTRPWMELYAKRLGIQWFEPQKEAA